MLRRPGFQQEVDFWVPSGWHWVVTSGALRGRIFRVLMLVVAPGLEIEIVSVALTFRGLRISVSLVCVRVELEKLKPSVDSSGIIGAGDFAAASSCPAGRATGAGTMVKVRLAGAVSSL